MSKNTKLCLTYTDFLGVSALEYSASFGHSYKREVVGISQDTDIFALRDRISDTIGQMCEPQIMCGLTIFIHA